jgi:lysophospholipase L1-like esterase
LVPFSSGTLGREYFADGFHLNAEGARVFTKALAPKLLEWTGSPR